jgi:site-specific DNA-methyltransferase (adenine-specific)
MRTILEHDRALLVHGDSREVLASLPEASVDAVVTDPPYELGFMAKAWDKQGVAFDPEFWALVLRVLKPGGHLLAFGGSRTYHRIACAIEDAGFELRDAVQWWYATGFPKSLDVSKAVDARLGAERAVVGQQGAPGSIMQRMSTDDKPREGWKGTAGWSGEVLGPAVTAAAWSGWGTALKPAYEPVVVARKPLGMTVAECVLAHGTGAINVDGCRIGSESTVTERRGHSGDHASFGSDGRKFSRENPPGRWPANVILQHAGGENGCVAWWDGDKQLGGVDCAEGCPVAELDRQSGSSRSGAPRAARGKRAGGFGDVGADRGDPVPNGPQHGDAGGASRFFYVAKPSSRERDWGCEDLPVRTGGEATDREDGSAGLSSPRAGAGRKGGRRNAHPTVKPVELMRYLVRLVCPPGGTVLDPFAGSGTTGIAALAEGHDFVGVELTDEYLPVLEARVRRALREYAGVDGG